jgi:hypothetical protein
MQAVKTIGLDIAKSGFQVHGVASSISSRKWSAGPAVGLKSIPAVP